MIQSLPLIVFLAMVAFLLAMAGVAVFAGVHALRRARLIRAMPTSSIDTAEDGYREFEGHIEPIGGQALTSRLTLSPCCWYHARIEKWESSGSSEKQGRWTTVEDVTSDAPFLLRDATGVCIVNPYGAEVTPTDKSLWYGRHKEPSDRNPPRVGPTESAKGMIEVAGGPNSKFRYHEERIYAGDPLLVLGHFTTERPEAEPDEPDDEFDGGLNDLMDGESAAATVNVEDRDFDELTALAAGITSRSISCGPRTQPFIMTTTPQGEHVAMSQKGGLGAFLIALVPLALAAYLLWIRFG